MESFRFCRGSLRAVKTVLLNCFTNLSYARVMQTRMSNAFLYNKSSTFAISSFVQIISVQTMSTRLIMYAEPAAKFSYICSQLRQSGVLRLRLTPWESIHKSPARYEAQHCLDSLIIVISHLITRITAMKILHSRPDDKLLRDLIYVDTAHRLFIRSLPITG